MSEDRCGDELSQATGPASGSRSDVTPKVPAQRCVIRGCSAASSVAKQLEEEFESARPDRRRFWKRWLR
jgi:hypothetical protein